MELSDVAFRRINRNEKASGVASSQFSRKRCSSQRLPPIASYSFWLRTLKARRPVALTGQTVETKVSFCTPNKTKQPWRRLERKRRPATDQRPYASRPPCRPSRRSEKVRQTPAYHRATSACGRPRNASSPAWPGWRRRPTPRRTPGSLTRSIPSVSWRCFLTASQVLSSSAAGLKM